MSHPTTPGPVNRRSILLGGAAALGTTAVGGSALADGMSRRGAGTGRLVDPFTLGVASGDPLPGGVVLWTRLAPEPTAEDGKGGMPDRTVPVRWEVAEDETFTKIVQRGIAEAAPELGHSVHVEVDGLRPGAEYFYRFRVGDELSPAGRTRTAPAPGTLGELTMCFASCSHYGAGYFTAYRRMAEDEPGLILHLGDYQYEYPSSEDDVRTVLGPETRTLANYRQRHAQYKTDPDLQLAHATAPWLVVWDDHEAENNWADETPEEPQENWMKRRAAAFRAYYENMPLRSTSRPQGPDMQLYRRIQWGGLANFHMLDTRQYRHDQACGDGYNVECPERFAPNRSITGDRQEQWILDGFANTSARWDVLGQQVFFSQLDLTPGSGEGYNVDAWDGYVANRDRIAHAMGNSKVRNGVVLTGDVHRHWAAEIKDSHEHPDSRPVGTEFVTTSITSSGDGSDDTNRDVLDDNPHVKFYADRRGYVRTKFSGSRLRADYRVLPYVTRKGARTETAATFVVEDGDPTLHRA
ncbi:alkaline phosphatase D [Halopolyspora algeriensis]|uniref:Alkaline phosphatase D n=1 Tax=Halopolyspora algeriensis TaxID=1500506 RepID=A0A368VZ45_9ACTN|nr:alkaline phosphatase D family protein [Halopolyspora algeriensis]RCW46699.1 alkaline phosphatase D [Halopolyspora algeriensis]TQM46724.1 alkaline phosphatase D [Halopolyspora algeriensis]